MRVILTPKDSRIPPIVMVDGHRMNNRPVKPFTVALDPHPLTGWYEPPALKDGADLDRPDADGAFMPRRLLVERRTVTITGHTVRTTSSSASSSLDDSRFKDLMAAMVGVPVTMRVEDQSGAREADGYVSAQMTLGDEDEFFGVLRFALTLTLPDPLKYGPAVTFSLESASGSLHVENNGTAESLPAIHVSGNPTRVSVTCDGRTVSWSGTGVEQFDMDFRDMTPSAGSVGEDDAFAIPAGGANVSVTAQPDTARVSVTVRPAWK